MEHSNIKKSEDRYIKTPLHKHCFYLGSEIRYHIYLSASLQGISLEIDIVSINRFICCDSLFKKFILDFNKRIFLSFRF